MKNLRSSALERFSKNKSQAIIVGIFVGLLVALCVLPGYFVPGLSIICFSFIAIPILFATHLSFAYANIGKSMTMNSLFSYFKQYYHPKFFGSYRIIFSLFKMILIRFVLIVVSAAIAFLILSKQDPVGLNESFEAFNEFALGNTTKSLEEILAMNNGILNIYIFWTYVPSAIVSTMFFGYFISMSSLNVYFNMFLSSANGHFVRLIINDFNVKNKRKVRADYLKLNWPMIVLAIAFAIGGAFLAYFYIGKSYDLVSIVAIFGAALGCIFYLPFYFFNMQVIYEKYELSFKESTINVSKTMYERIKMNAQMAEEEKKAFEELLNKEEQEEPEEENKNDPFGS